MIKYIWVSFCQVLMRLCGVFLIIFYCSSGPYLFLLSFSRDMKRGIGYIVFGGASELRTVLFSHPARS